MSDFCNSGVLQMPYNLLKAINPKLAAWVRSVTFFEPVGSLIRIDFEKRKISVFTLEYYAANGYTLPEVDF